MNNKVSIITPLFNSGRFISETIESVLSQTYQNWEFIIVDDGSTDNSVDIVESYSKKDSRIILLKNNTNSGAAVSRNNGIKHAEGRFIAFLDSDDLWLPQKLEIQIEHMLKNNYPFTFTSYSKIDEAGAFKGMYVVNKDVSYTDILKTCSIGCLTAVYDTSLIGKIYMPDIRKRQDFALWLKILKIVPKAYVISTVLAKYRLRESSISSSKRNVLSYQWKVYRKIEKLSLLKSSYYFTCYAFYGVWNTYFRK